LIKKKLFKEIIDIDFNDLDELYNINKIFNFEITFPNVEIITDI
jgi:hypothetical protein